MRPAKVVAQSTPETFETQDGWLLESLSFATAGAVTLCRQRPNRRIQLAKHLLGKAARLEILFGGWCFERLVIYQPAKVLDTELAIVATEEQKRMPDRVDLVGGDFPPWHRAADDHELLEAVEAGGCHVQWFRAVDRIPLKKALMLEGKYCVGRMRRRRYSI